MKFENFLERWYDLNTEKLINFNEKRTEIKLGLNEFPGNLQKILTKLRTVGVIFNDYAFINKCFYSYKKDIYLRSSFVYFEFISYIINRVNNEIPGLYCTGETNLGKKENYPDIRELFEKRRNNQKQSSLITSFKEFYNNGVISLYIFPVKKDEEISLTDQVYINEIIKDAYLKLLNEVEKIISGEKPIFTESFIVKDKETKAEEFSVNLNFYEDKIEIDVNNQLNYDLKGLENINEDFKKLDLYSQYKSDIKNNYVYTLEIHKTKDWFIQYIISKLPNINLFKLNSEDKDFTIKCNKKDTSGYRLGKYIINEGSISLKEFKEMKENLEDDEEYSFILLNAVK